MKNIIYNHEGKTFHLQTKKVSYIMQIIKEGYLAHIYWGKKINEYHSSHSVRYADRAFSPNPNKDDRSFSLDTVPQESPAFGHTDFRIPSVRLRFPDGTHVSDFRYESHIIYEGKKKLSGLPSTYGSEEEVKTLVITLKDTSYDLYLELSYSVFNERSVIVRSTKIVNKSNQTFVIEKISSANVDFLEDDFEVLHLAGAWGRERHIQRQKLYQGLFSIESRRGASSHQHNPFIALVRPNTDEHKGEVYGLNFVYSGDFLAQVEKDAFNGVRLNIGLNPFTFNWKLTTGQSFQAPEVLMIYSDEGLNGFSNLSHTFLKNNLIRKDFLNTERPILINNWEATYFNFNEEKIMELADVAQELGVELFVLDDGWFGKRNSDTSSLGDWVPNVEKLPSGLKGLAEKIQKRNMKFGVWVEPEMVSEDSDLFRLHPDWCLQIEGRRHSESRNQLVLDLSRSDICDYIYNALDSLFSSSPISYVKWDMNRNMTESYSLSLDPLQKLETNHRYILGLYSILEKLIAKYPNILFESCSGGGGRYDSGLLYYMPQVWTSDNTDALSRLEIQYGTSLVYPINTMGSHVSEVPNHQVNRVSSLQFRGDVASSGVFGYELDLTRLSAKDKLEIKEQILEYKKNRKIIQKGDFYRLISPFETNESSWMFVLKETNEVIFYYFKKFAKAQEPFRTVKLVSLVPNAIYVCDQGNEYGGDELMNIGLQIPVLKGDMQSYKLHLKIKQI